MDMSEVCVYIPDYIVRDGRLGYLRNYVYSYIYLNTDNTYGIFNYNRKEFASYLGIKNTKESELKKNKTFTIALSTLKYLIGRYEVLIVNNESVIYDNISKSVNFDIKMTNGKFYLSLDNVNDNGCKFIEMNISYLDNDIKNECKEQQVSYYEVFNAICQIKIGVELVYQNLSKNKISRINRVIEKIDYLV